MSENNGWPGKPGVPLNPEREGWHWLCAKLGDPEPFYWNGNFWPGSDQWSTITFSQSTRYLGPCLTFAEVDARTATARKDALEEAARKCEGNFDSEMRGYGDHFAASIRALKGEGDD